MKIGVLAGTPVDTQMGIDYIRSKGFACCGRACSSCAESQNEMQILYKSELLERAIDLCMQMMAEGAEGIFVNCNSLSGAIDMNYLKSVITVPVVTPLDIYAQCAAQYNRLAIIAANGQSLAAIERVILSQNPNCVVFGSGLLPLVMEIEKSTPPSEIYHNFCLNSLTDCFAHVGCDALILGCTHFPYILKEIQEHMNTTVINPSDAMLDFLVQKTCCTI